METGRPYYFTIFVSVNLLSATKKKKSEHSAVQSEMCHGKIVMNRNQAGSDQVTQREVNIPIGRHFLHPWSRSSSRSPGLADWLGDVHRWPEAAGWAKAR